MESPPLAPRFQQLLSLRLCVPGLSRAEPGCCHRLQGRAGLLLCQEGPVPGEMGTGEGRGRPRLLSSLYL